MKFELSVIKRNKLVFSGIAILLVLLYHQPPNGINFHSIFYPGFIGVDIFIFFSGYSLTFSFEKNNLFNFYKRRCSRILPSYVFMAALVSISCYIKTCTFSFWDFFCNITTLSYYELGGTVFEWYLSAMILFYAFFPLLYKIRELFLNKLFLYICWFVILCLFSVLDLSWQFETALGRIPIFCVGISCAKDFKYLKQSVIPFLITFIFALVLYYFNLIHTYVLIYLLSPMVIIGLGKVVQYIETKKIKTIFEILGKASISIYISNIIIMSFMPNTLHGYILTFTYWLAHVLFVPIVFYLDKLILKSLR